MSKDICSRTSLIRGAIYIAIGFVFISFISSIGNLDNSILIAWSGETVGNDRWAIRGQIGDIMSGHFSALAFLAVALSIILQQEANKQMNISIEKQEESLNQQSEALEVQSKSLESQIEELKESRRESERQTEEFFIQNMNIKLDRYYKLLYVHLEKIDHKLLNDYKEVIQYLANEQDTQTQNYLVSKELLSRYSILFDNVIIFLDFIYKEIGSIRKTYPNAYVLFREELKLQLTSHKYFMNRIKKEYADGNKCKALEMFEE